MESLRQQQVFFSQMEWRHLWVSPIIMGLTAWLKPWAEVVMESELQARGWVHRWPKQNLNSSPYSKPSKSKYTIQVYNISLSFPPSLPPPPSFRSPLLVCTYFLFTYMYHLIICLPTMWKELSLKSITCHTTPVVWAKGKAVGMWIQ